jgi:hypothetical protein
LLGAVALRLGCPAWALWLAAPALLWAHCRRVARSGELRDGV